MKFKPFFGILLLTSAVSMANNAVSETNGKFGVMNGSMDSNSATLVEGGITWPIQECFGIQLDGLYSNVGQRPYGFTQVEDADFGGVGGHVFWRDSGNAMLGFEVGYVFSDPVNSWELGIEAERYWQWLTIGAKAGVASIQHDQSRPFIETDKDAFFCQLYLDAYPVDNLLVSAMVENRFDNTCFSIEAEYQLPVPSLSVFATAMKGSHGYDHAFVGMRYYFGEEKPLKNRHRESDPGSALPGILYGIGTHTAEIHEQVVRNANQSVETGPPSSGGSLGGSGAIGGGSTGGGTVIGPGNSPGGLTFVGETMTLDPGASLDWLFSLPGDSGGNRTFP